MNRLIVIITSCSTASFFIGHEFGVWRNNKEISNPIAALLTQPFVIDKTTIGLSSIQEANKIEGETEFWKASRSSEIMKFGYPGFDNLRTFENFVLSYDRRMRTAHWVVEHLNPERITYNENVNRSKSEFKPDTSIHPFFQSQNSDYFVDFI